MLKEKDIVHENGDFWVLADKKGFHVMRSGLTHSTCDSAYATLDLAIVRCDYLANANLIAAAPELLEALQLCVSAMETGMVDFNPADDYAIVRAQSAIAKALGETK